MAEAAAMVVRMAGRGFEFSLFPAGFILITGGDRIILPSVGNSSLARAVFLL